MISDKEDSYSDESYYTIKVFVNSGNINRYKNSDIEKIIMEGFLVSFRLVDEMVA